MPEFGLTEAHEALPCDARDFARRALLPGVAERQNMDHLSPEIIAKVAQAGYTGMMVRKEYGGEELDAVSLGVVVEEFSKVDWNVGSIIVTPNLMGALFDAGTEEQRREWLPRLISGQTMACICLTEPSCGSDAAAIQTGVVRQGDSYVINGEKTSITRGMQSNLLLVFAKTDPAAGPRGVSLLLVPTDTPGLSRYPMMDMGWSQMRRATAFFDDVRVPVTNLIGREGDGFRLVMDRFDVIRVLMCITVLGVAQTSVAEVIEYSKQRTAFGKPLAKFEAVAFKIAEALTLIDAGRLMCYRALWMRDQGMKHTKESAMCKGWIPRMVADILQDCLLTYGHMGYNDENAIQQRFRDAVAYQLADGTAEIQKLIIAREAIGREFIPT